MGIIYYMDGHCGLSSDCESLACCAVPPACSILTYPRNMALSDGPHYVSLITSKPICANFKDD
jgi:hypothetical protein